MTTTSTSRPSFADRAGAKPRRAAVPEIVRSDREVHGVAAGEPGQARTQRLWGTDAVVLVTERSHGDLRPAELRRSELGGRVRPAGLLAAERLRREILDRPWRFVEQVHGAAVLVVGEAASAAGVATGVGRDDSTPSAVVGVGDALVSREKGLCLAVLGADCGLIGLASPQGVIAATHAGWRGLAADVVGQTVTAMRAAGAGSVVATIGPCIHPCCYRFGAGDLEQLLATCPDAVRGETADGEPALDLPASLRRSLERHGVSVQEGLGGCTGCSEQRWFSHRRRDERSRHALAIYREPA